MVKADPKRNYYADLEISPTATTEDIKKQFRQLARIYHPDRNPGKEVEFVPRFQAIQAANEILSDPEQRAKYDADRRRLGYGPRTSPQQAKPAYSAQQWQAYGGYRAPGTGPYAQGASAYNNFKHAGYNAGMPPQAPPRPHPTSNARERMRTSSGFQRPTAAGTSGGAGAWTDARPPPSGYRYKSQPAPKDDADMYFNAFSSFGPRRASHASARKGSGADGGETRRGKKSGFDPNVPGADEPSAKTAGYNTRPREDASVPTSEAEVSGGSGQQRPAQKQAESSDELQEVSRKTRAKRAERAAAKKKAVELAAEKKSEARKWAAGARTAGFASARSGSEADSSGSNPKPATPGERVKAVPSRKWKNLRSEEAVNGPDTAEADNVYGTFSFSFPKPQTEPEQGVMEDLFSMPSVRVDAKDEIKKQQQSSLPQPLQEARLFENINTRAMPWTRPEQTQSRFADWFAHLPSSTPRDEAGKKPGVFTYTPHFRVFESSSGVLFEEVSPTKEKSIADDTTPRASSAPSTKSHSPSKQPNVAYQKGPLPAEADLIAQMRSLPKTAFDTFTKSKTYYTNIFPSQRNATPTADTPKAPSINTQFSAEDWGNKPFTFGSPNMSATSSQASHAEAPKPFPGPNMFAPTNDDAEPTVADETGKAPGPTVEEVPENPEKSAPPVTHTVPSQHVDEPQEKGLPVKFSVEHWEKTFKPSVFELPKAPIKLPAQSAPGVKTASGTRKPSAQRIRSPSKTSDHSSSDSIPAGSAVRPIVIEEDKSDDADAMDIDTPPNSTETARGPRLVRVTASRPEWRDSKAAGNAQTETAAQAPGQTTPASERSRKSAVRDTKAAQSTPPSALNMASLKSHLSSQEGGVSDLDDLLVSLPFESKASTQHPASTKYEDITIAVSHPKPPRAPELPKSGTITKKQYLNLLSAMSSYMGAFHKYEAQTLAQFSLRCKEGARFGSGVPSTEATALLNAMGEPEGKGVYAYAKALREEQSARIEWVRATEDYMKVVAGWTVLKGMVLERGFLKSG